MAPPSKNFVGHFPQIPLARFGNFIAVASRGSLVGLA
jgi:hypothetical protein